MHVIPVYALQVLEESTNMVKKYLNAMVIITV